MKTRFLFSLLLLTSVIVLGIIVANREKSGAINEAVYLTDIQASTINKIVIRRSNTDAIKFKKQLGTWFIDSPLKARARPARIESMLGLLHSRSFARIDSTASQARAFQLDPAAVVLQMDNHQFYFGSTDPLDEHRYVRYGNTVHLVSDYLFHQLLQPPLFFISTRLVPEDEPIVSIHFSAGTVSKSNGKWAVFPAIPGIEQGFPEKLVNAWQTGEAREVQVYEMSQGPDKVMLTFRSGRSAKFDIVAGESSLLLGRPDLGLQYVFDQGMANTLLLASGG